jgi:hypothetical protein
MNRDCFRCWRTLPRECFTRIVLVDLDVARNMVGQSSIYVCGDCLLAWRARREAMGGAASTAPPPSWSDFHSDAFADSADE